MSEPQPLSFNIIFCTKKKFICLFSVGLPDSYCEVSEDLETEIEEDLSGIQCHRAGVSNLWVLCEFFPVHQFFIFSYWKNREERSCRRRKPTTLLYCFLPIFPLSPPPPLVLTSLTRTDDNFRHTEEKNLTPLVEV